MSWMYYNNELNEVKYFKLNPNWATIFYTFDDFFSEEICLYSTLSNTNSAIFNEQYTCAINQLKYKQRDEITKEIKSQIVDTFIKSECRVEEYLRVDINFVVCSALILPHFGRIIFGVAPALSEARPFYAEIITYEIINDIIYALKSGKQTLGRREIVKYCEMFRDASKPLMKRREGADR